MATASVELLQYINEHVLECVICTEPFKEPKSLPCLHVFCNECIKTYIKHNRKGRQYRCPSCQETHHLPATGVDSLRDAFLQKSLLEVSYLIQKKTIPCTSCDSGSDAKSACSTCGDFLCTTCHASHTTLRPFRNHDLTPIEELGDTEKLADFQKMRYDSCVAHRGEVSKLFCNTDEKEICNMCTFDPEHKDHDVVTMAAKLQELNIGIKRIKTDIDQNIKVLDRQKKLIVGMLGDIEQKENEAMKKMSARVKKVNAMIQNFAKQINDEIKALTVDNKILLRDRLDRLETVIKQKTKLSNKCAFLNSLPVASALREAKYIIQSVKNTPEEPHQDFDIGDYCGVNSTISALDYTSIYPVLKSLIGFIPTSVGKEEKFEVVAGTDMPTKMQSVAVGVIHETIWENKNRHRNTSGYKDIAKMCSEKMTQKYTGSWNCFVATKTQAGGVSIDLPGPYLHIRIAGLTIQLFNSQKR